MAIIDTIDCGRSVLKQGPSSGQEPGSQLVGGGGTLSWGKGGKAQVRSMIMNVQSPTAIGSAAAYTRAATAFVVQQLVELARNPERNTVYIQWASGDAVLTADPWDGWYRLDDLTPLEWKWDRHVPCQVTATLVALGAPRRVALGYAGGALATNFSGQAVNLISLPVGSTAMETSFNRVGAEGNIPCISAPVASPEPLVLSTTIANIFKGGVHVYDTLNTGTNPVPTSGGTFVHANWVEVFGPDHTFVGDCVITNGLQLLIFVAGAAHLCTAYLWNTATATANWQKYADVNYQDNAHNIGTLQGYSLLRVGAEESSLVAALSTSGGKNAKFTLRLQRGRYDVRVDENLVMEGWANNLSNTTFSLVVVATPKIVYDSIIVADNVLETLSLAPTDYGYGAAFVANASQPFILGFLYQNGVSTAPYNSINSATLGIGDAAAFTAGSTKSYGWFAIPYGVSGSYSTANLQAEAEGGTLGTGWSSVADAAQSAGNVAKCASGTVATNADTWGTAFIPNPGTYDVWFRMKVTTNVGSAAEMTVGLWDSDSAAYVASGSTTFNRTALTTSYAWYRAASAVTPTATKNMRFRAVTALTLGTDWFIDEACLVPHSLTTDSRGPQDIAQHFQFDRTTRLIRP